MPLAAATNNWTIPEDAIIASLSNSAACRAWLGESTVNAAAARIYIDVVTEPADGESYTDAEKTSIWPCILISDSDEAPISYNATSTGLAGSCDFNANGVKSVRFLQIVVDTQPLQEQIRTFKNAVGTTIEEVAALAGDEGRALIHTIRLTEPVAFINRDRESSYGREVSCEWSFSYGYGDPG